MNYLKCVLWVFWAVWLTPMHAQSKPASITVVLNEDRPPYLFRDAKGELQGVLKDRWSLWQARTGIHVNLLAVQWPQAEHIMQAGQADVIDTLTLTPERKKKYSFGEPYGRLGLTLLFHSSISGMVDIRSARGFTVGVLEGGACGPLLNAHGVTSVKRYPSYSDMVSAAVDGDVRVFCMDMPSAMHLLNQQNQLDEFRYSPAISQDEMGWAVRTDDGVLLRQIQAGFDSIPEADLQEVDRKWLGASLLTALPSPYARYTGHAAMVAGALALLLVIWTLALRQAVREKTHSLWEMVGALKQTRDDLEHVLGEQKAMLENDMVGFFRVASRRVTWANPAAEIIFGHGAGQLAGCYTKGLFLDDAAYHDLARQAYPLMSKGKLFRSELQFKRKDGTPLWLDVCGTILVRQSAESLWIFLDITERKHAQIVREQAAERLQKLANRVPGVVLQFVMRPDHSAFVPYCSDAISDIFQLAARDVQTNADALVKRLHPDDSQQVLDAIFHSFTHLTPWQLEYRIQLDDGSVRWLFGNALPERLEDGSVSWHGFITDITERRAADDRLRQLSRSVEQAPVSIVITDLCGCILYANPMFTRHTGYTLDEVVGKNPRILQSGLTPPEVFEDLWHTLGKGQVWHGELQNRHKNGALFFEQAVIAPVWDANGRVSHYVAINDDITQRKLASLALETSLKDKVALLHEVHHRVKNNLQIITSSSFH